MPPDETHEPLCWGYAISKTRPYLSALGHQFCPQGRVLAADPLPSKGSADTQRRAWQRGTGSLALLLNRWGRHDAPV